ncbi:hypothetical protein B0I37DRAFT_155359 [Chaetomium sp. MPI-CAGE-AT-0009]|nr:hypothetical protein B0I37DRAFT_155359 [Chaetomium sp. MPI-CAGE-AT-0009]
MLSAIRVPCSCSPSPFAPADRQAAQQPVALRRRLGASSPRHATRCESGRSALAGRTGWLHICRPAHEVAASCSSFVIHGEIGRGEVGHRSGPGSDTLGTGPGTTHIRKVRDRRRAHWQCPVLFQVSYFSGIKSPGRAGRKQPTCSVARVLPVSDLQGVSVLEARQKVPAPNFTHLPSMQYVELYALVGLLSSDAARQSSGWILEGPPSLSSSEVENHELGTCGTNQSFLLDEAVLVGFLG